MWCFPSIIPLIGSSKYLFPINLNSIFSGCGVREMTVHERQNLLNISFCRVVTAISVVGPILTYIVVLSEYISISVYIIFIIGRISGGSLQQKENGFECQTLWDAKLDCLLFGTTPIYNSSLTSVWQTLTSDVIGFLSSLNLTHVSGSVLVCVRFVAADSGSC